MTMFAISRRAVLDDPTLSIVRPDDFIKPGGIRPHDAGSLIGAGASILGGVLGSKASNKAADAASQSAQSGINEQQREFDLTRQDTAPYRKAGSAAENRLSVLLGLQKNAVDPRGNLTPQNFAGGNPAGDERFTRGYNTDGSDYYLDTQTGRKYETTPAGRAQAMADASNDPVGGPDQGYGDLTRSFSTADLNADPVYNSGLQFGLDQGTKAINARAIANGGYDSGATLKALTQFGNDYGSTKANDAYNRFNTNQSQIYNRLAGVSGAGQNAVNTVTSAGENMANNVSNLDTQAGNARAAGIVGNANSWNTALGGVTNAANNYTSNQTLQKLLASYTNGGGAMSAGDQWF